MSDQNVKNNKLHLAQTAVVALTTVAALAAGLSGVAANAQDQTQAPVLMAPPLSPASGTFDTNSDGGSGSDTPTPPAVSASSSPATQNVFQWQDVPQNRQVPITRAVFDKGGYQLTDDQGETIVVPFANQNLYVLRFGQTTGGMYFVNDGSTPTLYIPSNGYLENASAQGARWYPFPQSYAYTAPVYVGPAPSWSEWVGMGWYPDMVYYGGYYGYEPWSFGVEFGAFPGLYFSIGGHPYYGWNAYHTYYSYHSYNRFYVRDGARFGGYNAGRRGGNDFGSRPSHYSGGHGYGGYGGANAGSPARHSYSGGQASGSPSPSGSPRIFRGGQGSQGGQGGATFSGGHTSGGFSGSSSGSFRGGGDGHSFTGGRGGNYGSGSGGNVSRGGGGGGFSGSTGGGGGHMSGGGGQMSGGHFGGGSGNGGGGHR